jgi:hypothetical protein
MRLQVFDQWLDSICSLEVINDINIVLMRDFRVARKDLVKEDNAQSERILSSDYHCQRARASGAYERHADAAHGLLAPVSPEGTRGHASASGSEVFGWVS